MYLNDGSSTQTTKLARGFNIGVYTPIRRHTPRMWRFSCMKKQGTKKEESRKELHSRILLLLALTTMTARSYYDDCALFGIQVGDVTNNFQVLEVKQRPFFRTASAAERRCSLDSPRSGRRDSLQ